jgi:CheY-like chemotaxis protein
MSQRRNILIVDDEQDLLELYQALLSKLESTPRVMIADSGKRALAVLASEPFDLLVTDLNMPGMDGFQLLTVVRSKYPNIRTVVISGVSDDQYRARAYGMGIDVFLGKPSTDEDIRTFVDCVEGVLTREEAGGFRGFQSMSLVDLIQAECMAGSSCVLKITNGPIAGKVWIKDGDVIDAEAQSLKAEEGFLKILEWKTGNFEKLPEEPAHERAILSSYQGLLLDSAQTLDMAQAADQGLDGEGEGVEGTESLSGFGQITRCNGVEFVLSVESEDAEKVKSWGAESPDKLGGWAHGQLAQFRTIGEKLNIGQLKQAVGVGLKRHVALLPGSSASLCVGIQRSFSPSEVRETLKEISVKWDS